MEGFSATRLEG